MREGCDVDEEERGGWTAMGLGFETLGREGPDEDEVC